MNNDITEGEEEVSKSKFILVISFPVSFRLTTKAAVYFRALFSKQMFDYCMSLLFCFMCDLHARQLISHWAVAGKGDLRRCVRTRSET